MTEEHLIKNLTPYGLKRYKRLKLIGNVAIIGNNIYITDDNVPVLGLGWIQIEAYVIKLGIVPERCTKYPNDWVYRFFNHFSIETVIKSI